MTCPYIQLFMNGRHVPSASQAGLVAFGKSYPHTFDGPHRAQYLNDTGQGIDSEHTIAVACTRRNDDEALSPTASVNIHQIFVRVFKGRILNLITHIDAS